MFGLLKEKLSGFLDKLTKREEGRQGAKETPGQPQAEEKKGEKTTPAPKAAPQIPKPQEIARPNAEPQEIARQPPEPQKIEPQKIQSAQQSQAATPKEHQQPQEIAPVQPAFAQQKNAPEPQIPEQRKEEPEIEILQPQKPKELQQPAPKEHAPPQSKAMETPILPEKPAETKHAPGIIERIWPFGKKEEAQKITPPEDKMASPTQQKSARPEGGPAKETPPKMREDEMDFSRLEKKAKQEDRKMEVRMGIPRAITTILSSTVEIKEEDVRDLADELELALLEADVAYEVSVEVSRKLRERIVGMRVKKAAMQQEVRDAMAGVLVDVLRSKKDFDFVEKVRACQKPAKILFVGPNGAGKTTTMAKIARMLHSQGMECVFSASDTFRAAAIEQAEAHAEKLGLHVVKSRYGADPASVAFDAVGYAKSHGAAVVLIDSAGRQDTNTNLLDELKKMVRVIKPDLKIYIGESIGGNATLEQIKGFSESTGLDGVILTKLDCDAKGGTALSVAHTSGVPILFLGTGQGYEDIERFDAGKLARALVGAGAAS